MSSPMNHLEVKAGSRMRYLSLLDLARPNSVLKVIFYNVLFFNIAACVAIHPNSTLLQNGDGCTSSADWLGHSIDVEDCSGTINKLYKIEVLKHGMNVFEFLGKGVHPEYKLPVMQTPRRYSVGKPLARHIFLRSSVLTSEKANARLSSQCWTFSLMEIFQMPPQALFTQRISRVFVISRC